MKENYKKWLITAFVLFINALLWIVPSNIAYLIAQQRDILLGRYTLERFITLLVLIPVSAAILYLNWSNKENERKRQFQIIALSVSVLVSMLTIDVFLRLIQCKNYVGQSDLYHRTPNTSQNGVTKDVPEATFSYPTSPAGYPDINFTLTVDKRGFRNQTDLPKYDIVAIGDSFTEGSGVSDDQAWPVVLVQKSGYTVYNLGMSGGNPLTYLETFKRYAVPLLPKTVICMLYEGNDFRDANFKKKGRLSIYFKTSPLRNIIQNSMIRCFGSSTRNQPANKNPDNEQTVVDVPATSVNALSWLPAAVPDGQDGKYYAFKVKALATHLTDKTAFINSTGCRKTFEFIGEIKKICDKKNIRFILVCAPDKPHLLLPLIRQKLSPEQLHAFLSLKEKDLPPAKELMETVLSRINIAETATEEFCRSQSIEFVSLTKALSETIAGGRQAYFTYDQHWTPIGQETAAETIYNYLQTASSKP
jgi:hypothetical protein